MLRMTLSGIAISSCLSGCITQTYRDIRPEHWAWWGADMALVEETMAKVRAAKRGERFWDDAREHAPGTWTYEFQRVGEDLHRHAQAAEGKGDLSEASKLYHEASVYFGLAKYPHIFPTAAEEKAYAMQLEAYGQSFSLEGYGYEMVSATLGGQKLSGFLHLPRPEFFPAPVVLGSGGLDVFAPESGPLVRDLLDRGIAVLMFDIPGTGMNRHIPLTPGFEQAHLALLGALKNDVRIDHARVGAFGISFAGNAVSKLALTEQETFDAVANIGGPLHEVFTIQPRLVREIEPMYLGGLVDRMHLEKTDPVSLVKAVRGFSLVNQGLLGSGQKTSVPVLSMNAKGDYVAPESDMLLMTRASREGELIWSGEGNHCPQNRLRDMPKIAEFFERHLKN